MGIRTPDLLHAKQPLSQLSYTPVYGGDEGDRTLDLLNAIQMRSQLRYAPT